MFRRFEFEKEVSETLDLMPMTVRRKLDLLGVKLHLKQWQSLSRVERLVVCHFPVDSREEREVLTAYLAEATTRRDGSNISLVTPAASGTQSEQDGIPPEVERVMRELKLPVQAWYRLDSDERFALARLARRGADKFAAAWREFESDRRTSIVGQRRV
jgi:hypothetical protein